MNTQPALDIGIDWDDAFENGAYIEGAAEFPPKWAALAEAFRSNAVKADIDLAYGPEPRSKLDLFLPDGTPKGLVVFVHGGYWVAFDKSFWSHLAAGPIENGWAVAMPSYTLAPEAMLPQITAQIGAAIAFAATKVDGPIRLTGHSAGGHLVSRMVCDDAALTRDVRDRVDRVVSISGLHDLRPLQATAKNESLRLTPDTARLESAICHAPEGSAEITAWVGGRERPEFLRQSSLLVEIWGRLGADTKLVVDDGRHHFDVIDGLANPDSDLTRAMTGD